MLVVTFDEAEGEMQKIHICLPAPDALCKLGTTVIRDTYRLQRNRLNFYQTEGAQLSQANTVVCHKTNLLLCFLDKIT